MYFHVCEVAIEQDRLLTTELTVGAQSILCPEVSDRALKPCTSCPTSGLIQAQLLALCYLSCVRELVSKLWVSSLATQWTHLGN